MKYKQQENCWMSNDDSLGLKNKHSQYGEIAQKVTLEGRTVVYTESWLWSYL